MSTSIPSCSTEGKHITYIRDGIPKSEPDLATECRELRANHLNDTIEWVAQDVALKLASLKPLDPMLESGSGEQFKTSRAAPSHAELVD
jgi:hypothetical protein